MFKKDIAKIDIFHEIDKSYPRFLQKPSKNTQDPCGKQRPNNNFEL